jgi:hypothetical protein
MTTTTGLNNQIKTILISDDVNQKCIEILENNDLKVTKNTKLTPNELKEEIRVNGFFTYLIIANIY